jgi:hypothetical protein
MNKSTVNRDEYLNFFTNWIFYQFDKPSSRIRNILIIRQVSKIVSNDEKAAYWGGRDLWTMHDRAVEAMEDVAIEAVTA